MVNKLALTFHNFAAIRWMWQKLWLRSLRSDLQSYWSTLHNHRLRAKLKYWCHNVAYQQTKNQKTMSTYTVNISIDSASVAKLTQNGYKVGIAKQNNPLNGVYPTTWLAITPFQNITVEYTLNYGLYVSDVYPDAGAVISLNANSGALIGNAYKFSSSDNAFHQTGPTLPTTIQLSVDKDWTCGLTLPSTVNGKQTLSPLNAARVLSNTAANFTPVNKVYVYLTQTSNNGVVITSIAGQSCEVDLTFATSASLVFVSATNSFQLVTSNLMAQKEIPAHLLK